tara:strand:- start:64 stop:480 length:417 start_codon:yes stop_codon:yes gene_type:complete
MKFTKDTIRHLIAEEIQNYLNEQSEQGDWAMQTLRKYFKDEETFKAFQDLRKKYPEEELKDPKPLPPGKEKQYPAADPDAVLGPAPPGFQLDTDDTPAGADGVEPTEIVPALQVGIGEPPKNPDAPARTMYKRSLDKK